MRHLIDPMDLSVEEVDKNAPKILSCNGKVDGNADYVY